MGETVFRERGQRGLPGRGGIYKLTPFKQAQGRPGLPDSAGKACSLAMGSLEDQEALWRKPLRERG